MHVNVDKKTYNIVYKTTKPLLKNITHMFILKSTLVSLESTLSTIFNFYVLIWIDFPCNTAVIKVGALLVLDSRMIVFVLAVIALYNKDKFHSKIIGLW